MSGRSGEHPLHDELQRVFPNVYGPRISTPVVVPPRPQASSRPQVPRSLQQGGGTRVVTEALHRVGQSLQNSTVQAVLAPTCPTNVETNTSTSTRLPTPMMSVTNRSASLRLPTCPMTIRPDSQRGGNGQVRLCNDGISLMPSTSYRQPSASSVHGQLRLLQNSSRSRPYYNPRQTYLPGSGSRLRRCPPTYDSRRARQAPLGRKFSKNIVLVNSDEVMVPKARRRQQLHEAGALIHSVNFFPNWAEAEVRGAIERALGGVLDDSKPQPRFEFLKAMNGQLVVPNVEPLHEWTGDKIRDIAGQGDLYIRTTYPLHLEPPDETTPSQSGPEPQAAFCLDESEDEEKKCCEQPSGERTYDQEDDKHKGDVLYLEEILGMYCNRHLVETTLNDCEGNVEKALNILLDNAASVGTGCEAMNETKASSSTVSEPGCSYNPENMSSLPLSTILSRHSEKVISTRCFDLEVNRAKLWRRAFSFYKNSRHSKDRLHATLTVEFEGEQGIDGGALKYDFLESALAEANERYFVGDRFCRLPKKDWSEEGNFEMIGLMIAHSILQGGPAFPVLCPAMYELLARDREAAVQSLPMKSDIPLDMASVDLHDLIEKLDGASSQDEVDAVLDEEKYMSIINASGWDLTKKVTQVTKNNLVQGLIVEEVIGKRERQMCAMKNGLEWAGFLDLIRQYPEKMRPLLVHCGSELTYNQFQALIYSAPPSQPVERRAYEWFFEYIAQCAQESADSPLEGKEKANLEDLLKFATGTRQIPPMATKQTITLMYLPTYKMLPEAAACFWYLYLPTGHTSKETFFHAFDQAVLMSLNYFGRE